MFNDAHHDDRKRSPKDPGKGHAHHGHHGPDKGHTMIYKSNGKGKGKGKGTFVNENPDDWHQEGEEEWLDEENLDEAND
eukprot:1123864-Heterocapsa_arctica.AAC.1